MSKKVIQVPVDEDLLGELDRVSKSSGRARAEIIREACREHLRRLELEEMDKAYVKGYSKVPETPAWGELGAQMVAEGLKDEEPW